MNSSDSKSAAGAGGGGGGGYKSSWWQTSYNHAYGGPEESFRRENHPLMPKDDYITLVQL